MNSYIFIESLSTVLVFVNNMFFVFIILWLLGFFELNSMFFLHLLDLWQSFVTELIRNSVSLILYQSKDYIRSFFGFFLLGSLSAMYIFSRFNAISFILLGFVLGIVSKDFKLHQENKIPNAINIRVTANEDSYCPLDFPSNIEVISEQINLNYLDFWYVFF